MARTLLIGSLCISVARILVVDDDPEIRNIVGQVLREAGYGVVTAANGVEALERMPERPPDGIVLDLNMPVMDGKTFLAACRTDPAYANVPVALFTTSVGADGLGDDLDVQVCIAKPFDVDGLTEAVGRLVRPPGAVEQESRPPARRVPGLQRRPPSLSIGR